MSEKKFYQHKGFWIFITIASLMIAMAVMSGCEKPENDSSVSEVAATDGLVSPNPFQPEPVIKEYAWESSYLEKKGGVPANGGGNGNGNPNNPPSTQPVREFLPPIYSDWNITWQASGGCTIINWDPQPNELGYAIWFKDNCYCSTTEVDDHSFPDGTYYKKHYNATTEEAYLGCLHEIGKDKWYEIRIRSYTTNLQNDTLWIQPYVSDLASIYVD